VTHLTEQNAGKHQEGKKTRAALLRACVTRHGDRCGQPAPCRRSPAPGVSAVAVDPQDQVTLPSHGLVVEDAHLEA